MYCPVNKKSNRSQMFFTLGGLNNFAKFTGKRLKPNNLIKKKLQHRCFSVNVAKFLSFYGTPLMAVSVTRKLRLEKDQGNAAVNKCSVL